MSSAVAAAAPAAADPSPAVELDRLHGHWAKFLFAGTLMAALGLFAIGWSCLTTLTLLTVWIAGAFLLAGGVTEIVAAFSAGRWRGRLLHVLMGVMYLVIGFMFMTEPKDSALRLTLIIAIFLIVGGIFRIVHALSERGPARGAVLLSGVISLMLGLSVYRQWPVSGLWVIGLFIGVEMFFSGLSWITLALAARRAKRTPAAA